MCAPLAQLVRALGLNNQVVAGSNPATPTKPNCILCMLGPHFSFQAQTFTNLIENSVLVVRRCGNTRSHSEHGSET